MAILKCPNQDSLLEFISIPDEIPFYQNFSLRCHLALCADCKKSVETLQAKWDAFFKPEPDITSSLMSVYSRLKNDETLILKGWKLGNVTPPRRGFGNSLLSGGWLFRGAVSFGLGAILLVVVFSQLRSPHTEMAQNNSRVPFAQIRLQDKNRVRVQYVQPELLQTVEFETTRGR